MDPYLEDPLIWPDFHNDFASKIRQALNRDLPEPYYAQLDVRSEVGLFDEPEMRVIIPDVSVRRHSRDDIDGGGIAVAEPHAVVSECTEIIVEQEPVELASIEVRDARTHQVVTLIEILSPSNKRPGRDRSKFLEKRAEILQSNTSLVEIDLLRTGSRIWTDPDVARRLDSLDPPPDYLVLLNRAWQRGEELRLYAFRVSLLSRLPVVLIPLRQSEPEVTLDLQRAFEMTYDTGPYHKGAVDYDQPPKPRLTEAQQKWAAERIAAWRQR
jgi:hypothetical protein